MMSRGQTPAAVGSATGGHEGAHRRALGSRSITAADIAHALKARPAGRERWMARCLAHDDRTPSMALAQGANGPLVHCYAGCLQDELIAALRERGLWPGPTGAARSARRRRDEADLLWCVALRHLTHGEPLRFPPYTRSLPRSGKVWIVCGPGAWPAAQSLRAHGRHALVWPYTEHGHIPCTAYRWPVAGRAVRIYDTMDTLAPDDAWAKTVRDFGRLLVARWGACRTEVYTDAEPVAYWQEPRHAA